MSATGQPEPPTPPSAWRPATASQLVTFAAVSLHISGGLSDLSRRNVIEDAAVGVPGYGQAASRAANRRAITFGAISDLQRFCVEGSERNCYADFTCETAVLGRVAHTFRSAQPLHELSDWRRHVIDGRPLATDDWTLLATDIMRVATDAAGQPDRSKT